MRTEINKQLKKLSPPPKKREKKRIIILDSHVMDNVQLASAFLTFTSFICS